MTLLPPDAVKVELCPAQMVVGLADAVGALGGVQTTFKQCSVRVGVMLVTVGVNDAPDALLKLLVVGVDKVTEYVVVGGVKLEAGQPGSLSLIFPLASVRMML